MNHKIKRLQQSDLNNLKNLLLVFSLVFENKVISSADLPGDTHLQSLLERSDVYIFSAFDGEKTIGGLTGYELILPTKKEKEIYLYDLGVDASYRRRGVARALVRELKTHARSSGVSLIFVEAESDDSDAILFYKSLGAEQVKVDHFNIPVD